ncbi:alpha/beta hydrolase [Candidatus Methylacidiphilum infernorum]|uniref:Alpha/beta hydrolase n=1 Tax=Methylacidiphilum infernorum (isolate V4) TaxID=481448 RepID=B3DXU2_METI4|nr:alpha/beta hydrolase [Candidatus Methylacidiphilum infernorum]ACD83894.1 alpha/beta hydrolase [Methylacidiphilum infernorum V4]
MKTIFSHLFDCLSISLFNCFQKPCILAADFSVQLKLYVQYWQRASLEEYYLPDPRYEKKISASIASGLNRERRLIFPSFIRSPDSFSNYATFDLFPSIKGWNRSPTMIIVHGLLSLSLKGYKKWIHWLNEQGWNGVLMHLPYHFQRKSPSLLFSARCVQPNLVHTMETLRQSVMDLYTFTRGLRRVGSPLIAGWGISYGAWTISQLCSFDDTLHKLILVEPLLHVHYVIWQSPAGKEIRKKLTRLGITPSETYPHLRLACPSLSKPKLDGQDILIVGGLYDKISPPWILKEIKEKWKVDHLFFFPVGHLNNTLTSKSFKLALECWKDDFSLSHD